MVVTLTHTGEPVNIFIDVDEGYVIVAVASVKEFIIVEFTMLKPVRFTSLNLMVVLGVVEQGVFSAVSRQG